MRGSTVANSQGRLLVPLLQTKLQRPKLTGSVVDRPRLIERLNGSLDRKLTLVSAPAGFGKTTLLSAWLESCPFPGAWLSLDQRDNTLVLFLTYFVAAVRSIFPEALTDSLALVQTPSSPSLALLTATLINEINSLPRPFVLVLDDYHTVRQPEVDRLLSEFLLHWPRPMHLVIATREDPMLPLVAERAAGTMGELRGKDLRLDRGETVAYLQLMAHGTPSEELLTQLEEQVEGWITGLYLAVLALPLQETPNPAFAHVKINSGYALEFLGDQILAHQTPEVQHFLIRTSILDRLCASLADATIGPGLESLNVQEILETLEQTNLFTSALDDRHGWYRYHQLFQTMLQGKLQERYPAGEIAALHVRAAAWLERNGFVEEALQHALAGRDTELAVQIIDRHGHRVMDQQQWQRLESWVRMFPRDVVEQEPRLLMFEAWFTYVRFRILELPAVLDKIEVSLAGSTIDAGALGAIRGEVDTLRAWLFFTQSDGSQCLRYAGQALEALPLEWRYKRGTAWMTYICANWLEFGIDRAYRAIHEGLQADEARHQAIEAALLAAQCILDWSAADLASLLKTSQQMSQLLSISEVPDAFHWATYFRGLVRYQRNDLAAAQADFAELVGKPYAVQWLIYLHSAFGLALTYLAQGDTNRASQVIEEAGIFAIEIRNSASQLLVQVFRAELALQAGNIDVAVQWTRRLGSTLPTLPTIPFYVPEVTVAKVLLAQNSAAGLDQAEELLARLHTRMDRTHNTRFLIEVLALEAVLHDARGEEKAARAALERAVDMARPGGFIRLFLDLGPQMAALLERLRTRGVALEYLDDILRHASPVQPAGKSIIMPAQGLLTERETEILGLLAQRLSNKEIAEKLVVTPETVKRHSSNIYQKLDVKGRREAVAEAMALGILPRA